MHQEFSEKIYKKNFLNKGTLDSDKITVSENEKISATTKMSANRSKLATKRKIISRKGKYV